MSIKKITDILEKLRIHYSKENVLEFSFALLEWMGLKPIDHKIPQLILPKNDDLKKHLVNTDKTLQPQLYRLTSDNQSIRIRFAVLKKVSEHSLNQLVINDPGNESFQNSPGPLRAITKAPYYIHFATTSYFNGLTVVFNKNGKKGKILLKFRKTHIEFQYLKILKKWEGISSKSKIEIEDIFWESLEFPKSENFTLPYWAFWKKYIKLDETEHI
ncbi:MAG TPA: hypothetical protein VIK14_14565 [Ignavibacteria bacterium]